MKDPDEPEFIRPEPIPQEWLDWMDWIRSEWPVEMFGIPYDQLRIDSVEWRIVAIDSGRPEKDKI